MCGIAAIFAYHPEAPRIGVEELAQISAQMRTRGPDGQGAWVAPDGRVGLAHRRLAIIDLSERAAQPMPSQDGQIQLTYNGEIYNYRALRQELEAAGHRFQTSSDTEVIIKLYEEHGDAMLSRLRGMYAFALYDGRRRGLLLGRDPYGIKPLYYADDGRTLRVASQVRALLAGGRISREVDQAAIAGYYLLGSVPEPRTILRSVRALPAGSYLWLDGVSLGQPSRHFSVPSIFREAAARPIEITPAERQVRVREALLDSVKHHLEADVPVGAFLSAGIDSAALVALMRETGQADIQTVTLAFEEYRGTSWDEAPAAERLAERYGTQHVTRVVTKNDFFGHIESILEAMDQPTSDGINTWFVSKVTREVGLKVAISGVGGDELFGGYPSTFGQIPRWVRWFGPVKKVPGAARLWHQLARFAGGLAQGRLSPKTPGLLEFGSSYHAAYFLRRGLFMPWELGALMGEEAAREGLLKLDLLGSMAHSSDWTGGGSYPKIASLEASYYLRNQLLRDADWASMDHSLELRTPLVDAKLLSAVAPLLAAGGVGKELLANAPNPPLAAAVAGRPKTGFAIPVQAWLLEHGAHGFDRWRQVPALRAKRCPWARRMAYVSLQHALEQQVTS